MSSWEWLSNPANLVTVAQLIVAIVTAGATIALWHVTRILAVETKVLSSMTSRPFVVASFQSSLAAAEALDLVVMNSGNAAAFSIEVEITPALPGANGEKLQGTSSTLLTLSMLPPGASLPRQGVMSRDVYGEKYELRVSWTSSPADAKREEISYSMEAKDGFKGGWRAKGLHQIAEELGKIRDKIS